jgi:hypothetical protein
MSPPHMKAETDPVSETLFSSYLEFRAMAKVHNPNDRVTYIHHRQNPSDSSLRQPLKYLVSTAMLREMCRRAFEFKTLWLLFCETL